VSGALGSGGASQPTSGGAMGIGGAPGAGGAVGSGGTTQPTSGGAIGSGGRAGAASGGAASGGRTGSGGTGDGGTSAGTGGSALGGSSGAPEGGATSGGSAGASGGESGAEESPGCGQAPTLQNGTINISYNNASRNYILRLPDGYDNSHPYRLVFAYAESGASASQVASRDYFRMAGFDGSEDTIFVAPDAANGAGSWSNSDVGFTDAILEELENDLCIDTTRIFATGFSFGGGMAMAIACTRADVFRAVAFFSGADLTGSCPSTLTTPIAYYASQASEDANGMDITNPMTGEMKQAQFAAVNGCTAEPNSTNFPAAGQPHTCTIYQDCSSGHPTEYCVFNGPHGWEPVDPGENTSWDPPEAWKFITQF